MRNVFQTDGTLAKHAWASRAASTRTLLAKGGKLLWFFSGYVVCLKLAVTDQSFRTSMQACTCVFGAVII